MVGSPFLDLTEEMEKSVPSYSNTDLFDPNRFEEKLTVKAKNIPKRPSTFKELAGQSEEVEQRFSSLVNYKSAESEPSGP